MFRVYSSRYDRGDKHYMMVVRPIASEDLSQLLNLAKESECGLTSLPMDLKTLNMQIERSLLTWKGLLPCSEKRYSFILTDSINNLALGVCSIEVAVGLKEPWYNFRVSNQVHASRKLNIYKRLPVLSLSNDYTGSTELSGLFLHPSYRKEKNSHLLSKSRFLFIANFRKYFMERIIAEMRGVIYENAYSPFWDSVGKIFFSMKFSEADFLSGIGKKAFIAELIPKHPLYIEYLSQEAQSVIGTVHTKTVPAKILLEKEGFYYSNYIDIFDGGPTLECKLNKIHTIQKSYLCVTEKNKNNFDTKLSLVSNMHYKSFRACLLSVKKNSEKIQLNEEQFQVLCCKPGDIVRVVEIVD